MSILLFIVFGIVAGFLARAIMPGKQAMGIVMTGLILFVAASSLYALILGYSRIPYAAAKDGNFFRVFQHVHPTKHFPDVSLATIAIVSIPFCFFSLGQIVSWPRSAPTKLLEELQVVEVPTPSRGAVPLERITRARFTADVPTRRSRSLV